MKPLAIDLFCGLGGWSEGLIAEGYRVVGFDIERHRYPSREQVESEGVKVGGIDFNGYGTPGYKAVAFNGTAEKRLGPLTGGWSEYPGQLVIQDVLTIHGSQFKDAAVIVASPPCQNYSYLAMPWSRSTDPNNSKSAKALRRKWETEGPDNRLFDACFRIQREACEAAGRFIPLIVENVRGANEWVSPKSRYNYGSFHLWGDVPAIMPIQTTKHLKGKTNFHFYEKTGLPSPSWHGGEHEASVARAMEMIGVKVPSEDGGRRTDVGKGARFTSRDCGIEGTKQPAGKGDWFSKEARDGGASARFSSKSSARKAASAQIAKIPLPLAEHIARVFKPKLQGVSN